MLLYFRLTFVIYSPGGDATETNLLKKALDNIMNNTFN